jgi:hypothetical protein
LVTVQDEVVKVTQVDLSSGEKLVEEVLVEPSNEVVASVDVISDLGSDCQLIEFSNILGKGEFPLSEVHE